MSWLAQHHCLPIFTEIVRMHMPPEKCIHFLAILCRPGLHPQAPCLKFLSSPKILSHFNFLEEWRHLVLARNVCSLLVFHQQDLKVQEKIANAGSVSVPLTLILLLAISFHRSVSPIVTEDKSALPLPSNLGSFKKADFRYCAKWSKSATDSAEMRTAKQANAPEIPPF